LVLWSKHAVVIFYERSSAFAIKAKSHDDGHGEVSEIMIMLARGVGMGATATGESVGGVMRLMTMGIGRMWWIPFLLLTGAYHG
jgi:hypothetical protein